MRADFESFLREAAARKVPDEYGDLLADMFSPLDRPATDAEIEATEHRIGTSLPASFRFFLRVLGSGDWCDAGYVLPVEEVGAFPDGCWEMTGFIGIVGNVGGVGDHVAFNPLDDETLGDRPVYYCSHDPFGYARVGDSFEDWVRATAEARRRGEDFYEQFADAVWRNGKNSRLLTLNQNAGGSSGVDRDVRVTHRASEPASPVAALNRYAPRP